MMSHFTRDKNRKKLFRLLSHSNDEAYFQLVWAVDALQSDRVDLAARYIRFPREAATSDMSSRYAIFKWDLETLLTQLLVVPKYQLRDGKNRLTDCSKFEAASTAVNHLRSLENAEAGLYLKRLDVTDELHRIGQRQFPWQRGYLNLAQFYRYLFVYGQGDCARYFETTYGLTISDFSFIAFALHSQLQKRPWCSQQLLDTLDLSTAVQSAALALLSRPIDVARDEAEALLLDANAKHGAPLPTAYQPSFLRCTPIVAFGAKGERLRSPLPTLIVARTTAGLYYDIVGGGQKLLNEANERFETYSASYLKATMPRFSVDRSYRYKVGSNKIDTPDLFVRFEGKLVLVVECKATKLSFAAQFSDDPIVQAKKQYDQIAKGVFQLWRYFSHVRRGLLPKEATLPNPNGMVLTLDTWLTMSLRLQREVLSSATLLAQEDPNIVAEDRRPIVFCSIQDLEATLARSDEESFLQTVASALEDRFVGWQLPSIHAERGEKITEKAFPFDLGKILPWWSKLKE